MLVRGGRKRRRGWNRLHCKMKLMSGLLGARSQKLWHCGKTFECEAEPRVKSFDVTVCPVESTGTGGGGQEMDRGEPQTREKANCVPGNLSKKDSGRSSGGR